MSLNDWRREAERFSHIDRAIMRELEARMYVYVRGEGPHEQLYTVGFYKPDGTWEPESDHASA